jgi:hypothetical protein
MHPTPPDSIPSDGRQLIHRIPSGMQGVDCQVDRTILDGEKVFVRISGREVSLTEALGELERFREG